MAQVTVESRNFINDNGENVKYKRLVIRAPLEGIVQELELPLNKLQATFAEMLLNAEGEPAQVHTRRAEADELVSPVRKKADPEATSWLDD